MRLSPSTPTYLGAPYSTWDNSQMQLLISAALIEEGWLGYRDPNACNSEWLLIRSKRGSLLSRYRRFDPVGRSPEAA